MKIYPDDVDPGGIKVTHISYSSAKSCGEGKHDWRQVAYADIQMQKLCGRHKGMKCRICGFAKTYP